MNEFYEKAIEGRQHHQENFNHWMNMYAIFDGALLAAFYSLQASENEKPFVQFVILLLGCVAGWFWHFSTRGFYRWILSWIGMVFYYEDENNPVYKGFLRKDGENFRPFSTQKLTRAFTLVVAFAWMILLAWHCKNVFPCCSLCNLAVYIALIVIACVFVLVCAVSSCRENLEKSHKHLILKEGGTVELSKRL